MQHCMHVLIGLNYYDKSPGVQLTMYNIITHVQSYYAVHKTEIQIKSYW